MSQPNSSSKTGAVPGDRSYFEQQRDLLVQDIGASLEHVLQNINNLNRSLEGVISVGNEFSSVEALWSNFENIMAKDSATNNDARSAAEDAPTSAGQKKS